MKLQFLVLLIGFVLLCGTSVKRSVEEVKSRWEDLCIEHKFGRHDSFCIDRKYQAWQTLAKVLFGIFNYVGRTTRRLPRLYLLMIALTIWQTCKSFAKSLHQKHKQRDHYQTGEITKVLLAYEELKSISNLTRDLVGEMLISEIVEDIVYFSLEVQLRLRESDWFSIFVVFETWLVAFMAYFFAACAAEHVNTKTNKYLYLLFFLPWSMGCVYIPSG